MLLKHKLTNEQIDDIIKSTIKDVFDNKINGLRINNNLVLIVYNTLKKLYIDDCDNVTISAPTGSGKSIISYLLGYCSEIMTEKIYYHDTDAENDTILNKSFILTSSLMLQNQISDDIDRFEMKNINILMGKTNYYCINKMNVHLYSSQKNPEPSYEHIECVNDCPYQSAKNKAITSNLTVLNYAYFLRAVPTHNFSKRFLTICDEAHLVPEIIANSFSYNFNINDFKRIKNILTFLYQDKPEHISLLVDFSKLSKFFYTNYGKNNIEEFIKICNSMLFYLMQCKDDVKSFTVEAMKMHPPIKKIVSTFDKMLIKIGELKAFFIDIKDRQENLFINSEYSDDGFNFEIRDLDEKQVIKKYFINKSKKTVFLSATYGNMKVFLSNFLFKQSHSYRIGSDFDFSQSPIYLTQSGWLNYANFENNINNVLADMFYIVRNLHPNDNGIIHTGTFYISSLIKKSLEVQPDLRPKFLFYENSREKDEIIFKLKNATKLGDKKGYILVGPSLYEGLDLKDDEGRFNIFIKAPYLGMTPYVKAKMKLFNEWYFNVVLQRTEQGIGRTNRHKNDYSKIYLLDNSFKKIILALNKTFQQRLQYKNIRK